MFKTIFLLYVPSSECITPLLTADILTRKKKLCHAFFPGYHTGPMVPHQVGSWMAPFLRNDLKSLDRFFFKCLLCFLSEDI